MCKFLQIIKDKIKRMEKMQQKNKKNQTVLVSSSALHSFSSLQEYHVQLCRQISQNVFYSLLYNIPH